MHTGEGSGRKVKVSSCKSSCMNKAEGPGGKYCPSMERKLALLGRAGHTAVRSLAKAFSVCFETMGQTCAWAGERRVLDCSVSGCRE